MAPNFERPTQAGTNDIGEALKKAVDLKKGVVKERTLEENIAYYKNIPESKKINTVTQNNNPIKKIEIPDDKYKIAQEETQKRIEKINQEVNIEKETKRVEEAKVAQEKKVAAEYKKNFEQSPAGKLSKEVAKYLSEIRGEKVADEDRIYRSLDESMKSEASFFLDLESKLAEHKRVRASLVVQEQEVAKLANSPVREKDLELYKSANSEMETYQKVGGSVLARAWDKLRSYAEGPLNTFKVIKLKREIKDYEKIKVGEDNPQLKNAKAELKKLFYYRDLEKLRQEKRKEMVADENATFLERWSTGFGGYCKEKAKNYKNITKGLLDNRAKDIQETLAQRDLLRYQISYDRGEIEGARNDNSSLHALLKDLILTPVKIELNKLKDVGEIKNEEELKENFRILAGLDSYLRAEKIDLGTTDMPKGLRERYKETLEHNWSKIGMFYIENLKAGTVAIQAKMILDLLKEGGENTKFKKETVLEIIKNLKREIDNIAVGISKDPKDNEENKKKIEKRDYYQNLVNSLEKNNE